MQSQSIKEAGDNNCTEVISDDEGYWNFAYPGNRIERV